MWTTSKNPSHETPKIKTLTIHFTHDDVHVSSSHWLLLKILRNPTATTTNSENLLSQRLRFSARILSKDGHDAHRELNGFFFQGDNTLTVYEFRQFGSRWEKDSGKSGCCRGWVLRFKKQRYYIQVSLWLSRFFFMYCGEYIG